MADIVVLTFTYPAVATYFDDFLESLIKQTNKSFDLIIINDGMEKIEDYLNKHAVLSATVLDCRGTPAKNREYGLRVVKERGYKICVLADSDDFFSENRIEESSKSLKEACIVVNDLAITDSKGNLILDSYFGSKLSDGQLIDFNFIKSKNLLGFSNTAFLTDIIPSDITIPQDLKIVDWYFYTLLLYEGKSAVFNSKAKTYYRQSVNNIIGINNVNKENYRKRYLLKHEHYIYLSEKIPEMKSCATEYAADDTSFEKKYKSYLCNTINFPYWWEEI